MNKKQGMTLQQLSTAEIGALFVWVNNKLGYPKRLAEFLGRSDIKIVSPSWLSKDNLLEVRVSQIVIDHAAHLTTDQWEAWYLCQSRYRSNYAN